MVEMNGGEEYYPGVYEGCCSDWDRSCLHHPCAKPSFLLSTINQLNHFFSQHYLSHPDHYSLTLATISQFSNHFSIQKTTTTTKGFICLQTVVLCVSKPPPFAMKSTTAFVFIFLLAFLGLTIAKTKHEKMFEGMFFSFFFFCYNLVIFVIILFCSIPELAIFNQSNIYPSAYWRRSIWSRAYSILWWFTNAKTKHFGQPSPPSFQYPHTHLFTSQTFPLLYPLSRWISQKQTKN